MNTIHTKHGDHSREIRRCHQILMPRELKEQREKKLSTNEFHRRLRARTEVIELLKKMEAKGLTIDRLTTMVDGLPDPENRSRNAVQKGLQFPV